MAEGCDNSLRDQQSRTERRSRGTTRVETERYTSSNIPTMRKIVTIVMLFKLELAIASVSEASGAAPLT